MKGYIAFSDNRQDKGKKRASLKMSFPGPWNNRKTFG
jgi:hypothetical protein